MLEQIDLEQSVSKQEYRKRLPEFQAHMYDVEQAVLESRTPVMLIFEGWAGTSKIGTIGSLTRELDPRGLRMYSITPPRTYEQQYPWLYRFWLKTPSYGQIAIFDRSWYREILALRTRKELSIEEWQARCEDITAFERQLADNGTLILKFWLHIARKEQARRFKKLSADSLTAWQVTDEDHWQNRHYKRVRAAVEDLITRTDAPHARWIVVPATDRRAMQLAVFETIQHALDARLGNVTPLHARQSDGVYDEGSPAFRQPGSGANGSQNGALPAPEPPPPAINPPSGIAPGILRQIDLSQTVEEKSYEKQLARLQAKLYLLGLEVYRQQRPVVLVFEGWDAAGKGGAIKRITEKLDPRAYTVHSIAAPAGEDKSHHYLYRFWRRLPPRGAIAIFDRSWYGRVLVERVEGFAKPNEWQRAYAEINEFERQLISFGTITCKFWMHISPDEQLRRFEARKNVAYKAWKLTEEDWRNREKWGQYEQAADEMLLRTSTPAAPWTIVEAEDKRFARIKTLRTVVQRLEDALGKVKL